MHVRCSWGRGSYHAASGATDSLEVEETPAGQWHLVLHSGCVNGNGMRISKGEGQREKEGFRPESSCGTEYSVLTKVNQSLGGGNLYQYQYPKPLVSASTPSNL